MIITWLHLTNADFSELKAKQPWVLIPIGSIEQHGAHLPVGTDSFIVDLAIEEASKHLTESPPLLLMPTICFGKSLEHEDYIGTVTVSARTLLSLLDDIIESLARHDLKRVILVNSHGGNLALLDGYLQDLHQRYGVRIYAIQVPLLLNADNVEEFEAYDMHAGYIETSLMLARHPDLVKESRIPQISTSNPGLQHLRSIEGKASWGWETSDLTSDGVIGSPQKASLEAGKKMLSQLGIALYEAISVIIERTDLKSINGNR